MTQKGKGNWVIPTWVIIILLQLMFVFMESENVFLRLKSSCM